MRSLLSKRLIFILFSLILTYIVILKKNSVQLFIFKILNFHNVEKINVKIFDLSTQLNSEYDQIECKISTGYSNLNPLFCFHPNDYVSSILKSNNVYESEILNSIRNYLKEYKHALFLDVGAMIGAFSLVISKLGYQVVSVEPFYENVLRIHKASYLDKTYRNIVLINNAVSNKRNEIKMLKPLSSNIGGQTLLDYDNIKFTINKTNKYLVETILFDDIISYLPLKYDKTKYTTAILKIDIEGFEPYAFEHSNLLFSILDIKVIFMEWGMIKKNKNKTIAQNLIDTLKKRGYQVYDKEVMLNFNLWENWPIDVVWRKRDVKVM